MRGRLGRGPRSQEGGGMLCGCYFSVEVWEEWPLLLGKMVQPPPCVRVVGAFALATIGWVGGGVHGR